MTQRAAPSTYAEWLPLLERFRDGDDTVLDAMRAGTLDWTNVVSERWTARLWEAFSVRLKNVSSQLQLALDRARGDTFAISKAILAARRALAPLHIAATLPCAPESVRQRFSDEVTSFAARTQESLESSAKRNRADALLKVLRDTPLTAVAALPAPTPEADRPSDEQPPVGRGRRIIL